MVEGARLESVYTGNCIKGSNPFLSARKSRLTNKAVSYTHLDVYKRQVDDIDGNSKNIVIQIEPGSVLPDDDFLDDVSTNAVSYTHLDVYKRQVKKIAA